MTAARLIEIPCKHIASILEVHCKLGVLVKYNWFQTSVHYVEKQQAKFGVVNEIRIRHSSSLKKRNTQLRTVHYTKSLVLNLSGGLRWRVERQFNGVCKSTLECKVSSLVSRHGFEDSRSCDESGTGELSTSL